MKWFKLEKRNRMESNNILTNSKKNLYERAKEGLAYYLVDSTALMTESAPFYAFLKK